MPPDQNDRSVRLFSSLLFPYRWSAPARLAAGNRARGYSPSSPKRARQPGSWQAVDAADALTSLRGPQPVTARVRRLRTQHNQAKRLPRTAIEPACRCRLDEQHGVLWPLGLTHVYSLATSPAASRSGGLPLRARINEPSGVDIGRCGKTPCASCGFPSQCLS
jgi:hypothetical protein